MDGYTLNIKSGVESVNSYWKSQLAIKVQNLEILRERVSRLLTLLREIHHLRTETKDYFVEG